MSGSSVVASSTARESSTTGRAASSLTESGVAERCLNDDQSPLISSLQFIISSCWWYCLSVVYLDNLKII